MSMSDEVFRKLFYAVENLERTVQQMVTATNRNAFTLKQLAENYQHLKGKIDDLETAHQQLTAQVIPRDN